MMKIELVRAKGNEVLERKKAVLHYDVKIKPDLPTQSKHHMPVNYRNG